MLIKQSQNESGSNLICQAPYSVFNFRGLFLEVLFHTFKTKQQVQNCKAKVTLLKKFDPRSLASV